MRFPSSATLVVLSALFLTLAPDADGLRAGNRSRRDPGDMVERRVIVKYRDSVHSCMHCLLARQQDLAAAAGKEGERFAALHHSHGVRSARPVFRLEDEEARAFPEQEVVSTVALRRYHQQRLQAAGRLFPQRMSRAPRGVTMPDLHHVYSVQLGHGQDPLSAAAAFAKDANVEYAHPDYLIQADVVPNDPFFHSSGTWGQPYDDLWGLKSDRLDAARAWDVTQGEGVVVAVVDTGIDHTHEDLAANMWTNPREVAGNRVDDDRNGFVDDVRGWDFTTCTTFGRNRCRKAKDPDNDPVDDNLHGTHVAGTIAAVANNATGIVGVAPRARVMAVKGLNQDGSGSTSDLAAAIVYAAANGADVINNSWSCGFCPSVPANEDAVKAANGLGAVVVFAAGNSGRDNRVRSPQNLRRPKPIVVAASAPDDQPTFFTSFGATVDVAAPGGVAHSSEKANILSLRLSARCRACRPNSVGKSYLRLQGTSMAAPHAAGLAALVLSNRPGLSTQQVRQVLRASSDDVGLPGFDLRSGAGRINAARALGVATPLDVRIDSPRHLAAPRRQRVTVRGTAAGVGFSSYQLFARSEGDPDWVPITGVSESPVQGGVLGALSKSDLETGWNLLRLVALADDGRRYEDVVGLGRQPRPRQIVTDLPGLAFAPDISGNRVVWLQLNKPGRQRSGHVYMYDLGTKELKQLTEEIVFGAEPKISGDRVVWHDEFSNSESHIYACQVDALTGECPARLIENGRKPVIAGDRVTFQLNRSLSTIDLSSQSRREFGTRSRDYSAEGDIQAWIDTKLIDGERMDTVEVFDWATEELERAATHKIILEVRVSGRRVLYTTHESGVGGTLWVYDLDTNEERVLIGNWLSAPYLEFSGDRVAWPGVAEITIHDVATGRRRAAAIHPLAPRTAPAISGATLVWIDVTHSGEDAGDLYYAKLRD